MSKQAMMAVFHVCTGNVAWAREMHGSSSKVARVLAHEFQRVGKSKTGFVRLEMRDRYRWVTDVTFNWAVGTWRTAGYSEKAYT